MYSFRCEVSDENRKTVDMIITVPADPVAAVVGLRHEVLFLNVELVYTEEGIVPLYKATDVFLRSSG